jgi:hypothetical protein
VAEPAPGPDGARNESPWAADEDGNKIAEEGWMSELKRQAAG